MQVWIRVLGGAAAIVLIGVSASTNARFGYGLGDGTIDSALFAVGSVALDIFKVASVFFMMWALSSKQYLAGSVGAVVFGLCTAYSLTSAIGFAAENRAEKSASIDKPRRQRAGVERRLRDARRSLETLGSVRPVGEVQGDLSAHKRSVRWRLSKNCEDVTVKASRVYCAKYDRLEGELNLAQSSASVVEEIKRLELELKALDKQQVLDVSDPQAVALTQVLGFGFTEARTILSVLMACVIELVSAVGLYLAVQSGRSTAEPKKPFKPKQRTRKVTARNEAAEISQFTLERLERREGGQTPLNQLVKRFEAFCKEEGRAPAKRDALARSFKSVLEDAGVTLVRKGNQTVILGVGLVDVTSRRQDV